MSSTSLVPIGLQAYVQSFDITTTPQQLFNTGNVPGRYMLIFIQNGTTLLGGVDFVIDGQYIFLVAFYNFINVTKGVTPIPLGLRDGSNTMVLDYQDSNLLISCGVDTIPNMTFKSFIIAASYSGGNLYSVDRIIENTTGNGISFGSEIENEVISTGSVSFINTTSKSSWSNTTSSARRIGKNVFLSVTGTLTAGSLFSSGLIDVCSLSPSDKFNSDTVVTGSALIKNGSDYSDSVSIFNPSTSTVKVLIPDILTLNNTRTVNLSLSYIMS